MKLLLQRGSMHGFKRERSICHLAANTQEGIYNKLGNAVLKQLGSVEVN